MLEVFGGASARQFGAFGPHSEAVEYSWRMLDGNREYSPRTISVSDAPAVPTIPKSMVFEIVDFTTRWLEEQGFELLTRAGEGEAVPVHEYVLVPENTFVCADEQTLPLCDLEAGSSVSMSWLDGPIAKNTDRGLVSLDHAGGVCIYDTMTAISYHEERFKPTDPGGSDELRELMAELREAERVWPPEPQPLTVEARAADLLRCYGFSAGKNAAVVLYTANPIKSQLVMAGFRSMNKRWTRKLAGAGPKDKPVNPVELWLGSPDLVEISGLGYRPDKPFPTFVDDEGATIKNFFRRAEHKEGVGTVDAFIDFIEGLLPDPEERDWALDAIAYKALHPEAPTPAVILVDELGGVGKGLFFRMLVVLMGERNAGLLAQSAVFGGSNLANYQGDWGARVLHCIGELPSVAEATQKEQHAIYNRLKELIDPDVRTEIMPVKYGVPVEVFNCGTYWMATNHPDAIPIPDNDRRIVVLKCGVPRSPEYYASVVEWRDNPDNIACLYYWLAARDLSAFNPTIAPDTLAKTEMIEDTRYGSEVAVREWVDRVTDENGVRPPFLTTHMVLEAVRASDPMAFVSQTGTRRVNAALRKLGYHKPTGTTGLRVRINRLGVGAGDAENVLQHKDCKYVIGRTLDVEKVKKVVLEVGEIHKKSGAKDAHRLANLHSILIGKVVG